MLFILILLQMKKKSCHSLKEKKTQTLIPSVDAHYSSFFNFFKEQIDLYLFIYLFFVEFAFFGVTKT